MEFIKSEKLKYEYSRFNEETNENESIEALKGLDITIDSGEFVAVLGHNGSGKSTFAKLINGLYSPKDGVLIVNGYDTKVQENIWNIRQNVGMVFQNPDNQIIATVVEEDVAFGPENLGMNLKLLPKMLTRHCTQLVWRNSDIQLLIIFPVVRNREWLLPAYWL